MNIHEYRFLLADRATLKRFLSELDPSHVIERMSFEGRLRQVEEELKAYAGRSPEVVQARLTFRGAPVSGARGMSARFFSETLANFADATRCVGESVNPMVAESAGGAPADGDCELLLVGTLQGSFGFIVEDASGIPALEGEDTPVGEAVGRVKAILEASQEGGERLAEAIEGVDARALKAAEKFLRGVADGGAALSLEFRMSVCEFADADAVRISAERLREAATERG